MSAEELAALRDILGRMHVGQRHPADLSWLAVHGLHALEGVSVPTEPGAPDLAPLLAAAQAVCDAFPKTEPLTPRARALEDLRAAVAAAQPDSEA